MKLQRYKRDSEVSYAFGATLVAELLKTHPKTITRVFLRPAEKHGEDLIKIINDLKQRNIEIIESTKAFNILGTKDNCLLIAEFIKNLQLDNPKNSPKIVLVNPSDAGNLGTIMRSAAAFGYGQIAIVNPAVDPYDPKVIRASMGALFHLDIKTVDSIDELNLTSNSLAFILDENAVTLDEIASHYKQDGSQPDLVFGNEAAGLPEDFCEKTGTTPVFIPQTDFVDSLNLGVAASIALYAFRKI
ncbi:RNA methyltransferase [Candidatus Saccharibacteria bacterium]|nr:RNA methyltransferase [Candidatus Saccharibacteria bacterium]MBR3378390.1 RNA methyltransferase [Candidatus Saccharibacteria bacterium]